MCRESVHHKLFQLCLTLCNPVDHNLPAFSAHRILQARILKWVAVPSSMGSSWPRDWTHTSYISGIGGQIPYHWASQAAPSDKEHICQCQRHKRWGLDPYVGKIPWRRAWESTPVFLLGESHGQRTSVPWTEDHR